MFTVTNLKQTNCVTCEARPFDEGETGGNLYNRPYKTFQISNFPFILSLLLQWKSEGIAEEESC